MINLYIDSGDLFLEMIATGQRSCQVQRNDGPAVGPAVKDNPLGSKRDKHISAEYLVSIWWSLNLIDGNGWRQ